MARRIACPSPARSHPQQAHCLGGRAWLTLYNMAMVVVVVVAAVVVVVVAGDSNLGRGGGGGIRWVGLAHTLHRLNCRGCSCRLCRSMY